MRRCAFLTADSLEGFVTDDELAITPCRERGWHVELVSWRATADWASYDCVVIRSTWDYHKHPHAFLDALERIERATRLENPLEIVRANLRKTYLREMAALGVPVTPTAWLERLEPGRLAALFLELDADELILKPVVSANADDTFRVRRADARSTEPELLRLFGGRELMAQPFIADVLTHGEDSVIFMGGEVSHTIRKTPRPGDFRVQEEHGGWVRAVPPDPVLVRAARMAVAAVSGSPLYGRADFLRHPRLGYTLGELELIEPSLYLRLDPAAPDRLAEAIAARFADTPIGDRPE